MEFLDPGCVWSVTPVEAFDRFFAAGMVLGVVLWRTNIHARIVTRAFLRLKIAIGGPLMGCSVGRVLCPR